MDEVPSCPRTPRVVIIDDSVEICTALAKLLHAGTPPARVRCLPEATELIKEVKGHCPDAVVMDLDMPGPPALGLIGRLREECPDAGVLVLTGRCTPENVRAAIDAGAHGFVCKDEAPREIVKAIMGVARGGTAYSESAE